MAAEHLNAEHLADQRGGDMVGRAAEKAGAEFGPFDQRATPPDQLRVALRLLPGAVDAAIAAGAADLWREGHAVQIFGARLMVVERCGRSTRVAEGGMDGDVLDPLAVDIDGASVAQRAEMVFAGFAGLHRHTSMDLAALRLYSRGGGIRS